MAENEQTPEITAESQEPQPFVPATERAKGMASRIDALGISEDSTEKLVNDLKEKKALEGDAALDNIDEFDQTRLAHMKRAEAAEAARLAEVEEAFFAEPTAPELTPPQQKQSASLGQNWDELQAELDDDYMDVDENDLEPESTLVNDIPSTSSMPPLPEDALNQAPLEEMPISAVDTPRTSMIERETPLIDPEIMQELATESTTIQDSLEKLDTVVNERISETDIKTSPQNWAEKLNDELDGVAVAATQAEPEGTIDVDLTDLNAEAEIKTSPQNWTETLSNSLDSAPATPAEDLTEAAFFDSPPAYERMDENGRIRPASAGDNLTTDELVDARELHNPATGKTTAFYEDGTDIPTREDGTFERDAHGKPAWPDTPEGEKGSSVQQEFNAQMAARAAASEAPILETSGKPLNFDEEMARLKDKDTLRHHETGELLAFDTNGDLIAKQSNGTFAEQDGKPIWPLQGSETERDFNAQISAEKPAQETFMSAGAAQASFTPAEPQEIPRPQYPSDIGLPPVMIAEGVEHFTVSNAEKVPEGTPSSRLTALAQNNELASQLIEKERSNGLADIEIEKTLTNFSIAPDTTAADVTDKSASAAPIEKEVAPKEKSPAWKRATALAALVISTVAGMIGIGRPNEDTTADVAPAPAPHPTTSNLQASAAAEKSGPASSGPSLKEKREAELAKQERSTFDLTDPNVVNAAIASEDTQAKTKRNLSMSPETALIQSFDAQKERVAEHAQAELKDGTANGTPEEKQQFKEAMSDVIKHAKHAMNTAELEAASSAIKDLNGIAGGWTPATEGKGQAYENTVANLEASCTDGRTLSHVEQVTASRNTDGGQAR